MSPNVRARSRDETDAAAGDGEVFWRADRRYRVKARLRRGGG